MRGPGGTRGESRQIPRRENTSLTFLLSMSTLNLQKKEKEKAAKIMGGNKKKTISIRFEQKRGRVPFSADLQKKGKNQIRR